MRYVILAFAAFLILATGFTTSPAPGKGTPSEKKTPEEAGPSDQQKLQGTWSPVDVSKGGKKLGPDELAAITFKFEGDKISVNDKGRNEPNMTFKLDPTKRPKEIDIIPEPGPNRPGGGPDIRGIYQFTDGALTLRFGADKTARPTDFQKDVEANELQVILKRLAK